MATDLFTVDYDHLWNTVYGDVQNYGPTHRHTARLCAGILKKLHYNSVLDVGCGPGHNHDLLTCGRNVSFTGLDISSQAIRRAREEYPEDFFETLDITTGHLEKRFDFVFSGYTLEHIDNDMAALENMMAMSKRYLMLVTIQGNFSLYERTERLFGHLRNYRRGELQAAVHERGFNILELIEWGFPFYSPLSRLLTNYTPVRGVGRFGWCSRFLAALLHKIYYLNFKSHGDVLILLAERRLQSENIS